MRFSSLQSLNLWILFEDRFASCSVPGSCFGKAQRGKRVYRRRTYNLLLSRMLGNIHTGVFKNDSSPTRARKCAVRNCRVAKSTYSDEHCAKMSKKQHMKSLTTVCSCLYHRSVHRQNSFVRRKPYQYLFSLVLA